MYKLPISYRVALAYYSALCVLSTFIIYILVMGRSEISVMPPKLPALIIGVLIHVALLILFIFIKQRKSIITSGIVNILLLVCVLSIIFTSMVNLEFSVIYLVLLGSMMFANLLLIYETLLKVRAAIGVRR